MRRTSKALARIGVGVVATAAMLATPLALGTASAVTGTITATPDPALGTITATSTPPAGYAGDATFALQYSGSVAGSQTLQIFIAGSTSAYFPTAAGSTGHYASTGGQTATCTTSVGGACSVTVGDTVSESVSINVSDTSDPTVNGSGVETVNFNGLHFTQCSSSGINTPANCVTQGTVNTTTTTSVVYQEAGAGASGKNLTATLSGGSAQFTGTQPAGTTQVSLTTANCTTDSSGGCSFNVTDATQENVVITVTTANPAPYPVATAQQTIKFQAASVAPAELDLDSSKVIAPGNGVQGAAEGNLLAEPGDVIQNQYTLRGAPVQAGAGTPACVPAAGASVCPGVPLANTTLTLTVSDGFFTPNCDFPASTSPASLTNNNYDNCSFASAPAAGGQVGNLTSSGTSVTVKTDGMGRVVVSLGIGKDSGFDDDGIVDAQVSDGSLVPQVEGDVNSPSSATCGGSVPVDDPAVGGTGALPVGALSGCDITTEWTTDEAPLNGVGASYVVVPPIKNPTNTAILSENNYGANDHATINVPDVDRVVAVVHLTDQFGNLTSNRGAPALAQATITKTGPGNIIECTNFSQVDACSQGVAIGGAPQPDGTVDQFAEAIGSYTDNLPGDNGQVRYEFDANTPEAGNPVNNCPSASTCGDSGIPGVNDGTQTDTLSWNPPTTTFATYTAGTSTAPAFATYSYGQAATAVTDTLTFNFYNQLAQPVVKFTVKPHHKVKTSTAVTITAKVKDQFNNPIVLATVQFVRSGANEPSCTPIQNATNETILTNAAGVAGYTFSCDQPGVSNVSAVVTGPGGTQLAHGKEKVTFTGSAAGGKHEKPSLKVSSPKAHTIKVKIKTHPSVHHKTVHIYKVHNGLKKLLAVGHTNGHGKLHRMITGLKSGKTYHIDAKVVHLSAKYTSKYSKTKKVTVS